MNNTSLVFRLVNNAAKSPALSIAGPDVIFKFPPISFATMLANVVLPRPGGPYNNKWSKGSFLIFAAFKNISNLFLTFSCPIYSLSR